MLAKKLFRAQRVVKGSLLSRRHLPSSISATHFSAQHNTSQSRYLSSSLPYAKGGILTWQSVSPRHLVEPLAAAAIALKKAVELEDTTRLRESYTSFRQTYLDAGPAAHSIFEPSPASPAWQWTRRSSQDPIITPGILADIVTILSGPSPPTRSSASIEDVRFASEILFDMNVLFGMPIPELLATVLHGMASASPTEAMSWIRKAEEAQGTPSPTTVDDYLILLRGFQSTKDVNGMREVLNAVRNHPRLRMSVKLWQPYIMFLATATGQPEYDLAQMEIALDEMGHIDGLEPTVPLLSDVVLQYIRSNDYNGASKHVNALREILEPDSGTNTHSELCYAAAALTRYAAKAGGYSAALSEALSLREDGLPHNSHTMRTLIGMEDAPTFDEQSLVALADSLDVKVAPEVWSITIRRALQQPNGLERALALYQESKIRETVPTAGMVDPLIHFFCSRSSNPSPDDVDQALELYYDLRDAHKGSVRRIDRSFDKRRRFPDVGIFMSLLRGIARSRHASETTTDLMMQLLSDMRYFRVRLNPEFIQNVFTELLAVSDSHDNAFKIWSYIHEIDASALTQSDYTSVLEQFAKLSFEDDPLPSLTHYLDIVHSMRDSGVPITPFVYNVLFTRYASIARSLGEAEKTQDPETPEAEESHSLRVRILEAVKKLHLTLRIDATFTPTTATMNALMNAYNFLGAYQEAFSVWDELAYGTPTFDHISVNIALDVCGYAGDGASADRVWRRARGDVLRPRPEKVAFVPPVDNWATLIECRARLGRYEAAVTAFKEMLHADNRNLTPAPDLKCSEVMLKYARKNNDETRILKIISRYAPDVYQLLVTSGMVTPTRLIHA